MLATYNVLHNECYHWPDKTFQPIFFTYPFQSSLIVRICFEARI